MVFTYLTQEDLKNAKVRKWLEEEFNELNLNDKDLKENIIALVKNEDGFKFALQEKQVNFNFLLNFLTGPPASTKIDY